jgi:peptidyl-prolyl cis-trans isomerase SurA
MTVRYIQKLFKHSTRCFIVFFILLTPVSSLVPGVEGADIVDRIVAIVNDDIITLFELNRSLRPYADKIEELGYTPDREKQMLFKVREEILNKLIDEKIKDQEVKRFNITVDEQEVDKTIERIKESNFYTDEELREVLTADGITMEEYRERIKEQLLRSKLVNIEIKSKIVITQEDIRSYYESHSEKYGGEKKYHLRHILMAISLLATESERLKVKKNMEDVLGKLKDGEPFETMVAEYSESPLASEGGALGSFSLKALSPQLQEAVKDLKAGEFTPVLDTDQGYQIFLVEKITATPGKPIEEVSPEIERILFNEIVNKKFQSWLEELRERAHIKVVK